MYHRILVPVDGSPTSNRGLDEAIRLARITSGRLRLVHVIDELSFSLSMDAYAGYAGDWLGLLREGGQEILADAAATVCKAGVQVDTALRDNFSGPVHEQVNAEAKTWGADLVVLGTHGRRGAGRLFLGSGAEQILRTSAVPVLLIRSREPAAVAAVDAVGEIPVARTRISLPTAGLAFEK